MKPKSLADIKKGTDLGKYTTITTDQRVMSLAVALICLCGAWRPHISCQSFNDHPVYKGKADIISVGRIATAKYNKLVFERDRPNRFYIEVKENHYHYLSRLHSIFEGISSDSFVIDDPARLTGSRYLFRFEGDRVENLLAIMDHFRKII